MTDKELLEFAAKAIGLKLRYNYIGGRDANQPWDPLNDDGDALRLAVNLGICFGPNFDEDTAVAFGREGRNICEEYECDKYAATRRAITRAAAQVGEAMTSAA